jgi:hypothetical protein
MSEADVSHKVRPKHARIILGVRPFVVTGGGPVNTICMLIDVCNKYSRPCSRQCAA